MIPDSLQDPAQLVSRIRYAIARYFSVADDMATDATIDAEIRHNVILKGSTLWILMCASVLASIGLNINSTAVIIGAMLVSPLMGPIIGIGYGVGIYDFPLIKKSLLSLGIVTLISLFISTGYFLLSPLTEAQSELLARTSPTIWDVLIAVFGGLAGIIGTTRKEKSLVLPGVAIATALMPPLCTAGYGLANGKASFFLGALYLFFINCVFIAVASAIAIGFLKLQHRKFVGHHVERYVKRALILVVIMTAAPSLYLAYQLVGNEIFDSNARSFIKQEFHFKQTFVVDKTISPATRQIDLSLMGDPIDPETLNQITSRMEAAGLHGATLTVHQLDGHRVDASTLKASIINELYRDDLRVMNERAETIQKLQQQLADASRWKNVAPDILQELIIQYPELTDIVVGEGVSGETNTTAEDGMIPFLSAKTAKALAPEDRQRLERWFHARTKSKAVQVIIETSPAPVPKK